VYPHSLHLLWTIIYIEVDSEDLLLTQIDWMHGDIGRHVLVYIDYEHFGEMYGRHKGLFV